MTVTLWCWRCRKDVIMLEPHEWGVIQEARRAGRTYLEVLEREAARVPGRSFTHLAANASPEDKRLAYLVLAYELFAGEREFSGRIKEHHQSTLHGPPCAACGRPLRTTQARQCASCGATRHDLSATVRAECAADGVRLRAWPFRSIDEVLARVKRLNADARVQDEGAGGRAASTSTDRVGMHAHRPVCGLGLAQLRDVFRMVSDARWPTGLDEGNWVDLCVAQMPTEGHIHRRHSSAARIVHYQSVNMSARAAEALST